MEARSSPASLSRPYRSHLHPACFSCKKRKSRCRTNSPGEVCTMCQAYGTECIFPRPDDPPPPKCSPRRSAPSARSSRHLQGRHSPYPTPRTSRAADAAVTRGELDPPPISCPAAGVESSGTVEDGSRLNAFPHLVGIGAEAEDDGSHIVSPAVAEDNDILESYLSAIPTTRSRGVNRRFGPVRFNVVPRRPLGVVANQSLAAAKCEVIEKYMEPDIDEYLNLFFRTVNPCFPLFDEASFRSSYSSHKQNISPALLSNLYANSLIYWKSSPRLSSGRTPDIRYIWNQANEALHSELFLSPGISTIMAILLNVCGRPSTSMFGNGGILGMAVALSNALGLNRDPSSWNISPLEKSLRIRIWWLVIIHDRWCSLAYGTPLLVHRTQYDVSFPSISDICGPSAPEQTQAAASVFVALTSLTDILSHYLEHIYTVSRPSPSPEPRTTTTPESTLEDLLRTWEESLPPQIRHLVLRGHNLSTPGAANLRLAYLSVNLLLRRIQLKQSKASLDVDDDTLSPYYLHAQRAAEEIAYLVQELSESESRGFWIPVQAFSLTSAAMFLLRSGLRMRGSVGAGVGRNMPLGIAREMVRVLREKRRMFGWDLADHCLGYCGELVERVEAFGDGGGGVGGREGTGTGLSEIEGIGIPECTDIDRGLLEELFGLEEFGSGFEMW
ncbi:fungal-specific transcription factor domain-containing protein [Aspergillus egyptiacus]|nr:fungal-specific transcription factor domain-containing protein [Aspergillus egyptiacus]